MSKQQSQHILIVEGLKSDARLIERSLRKAKIANENELPKGFV